MHCEAGISNVVFVKPAAAQTAFRPTMMITQGRSLYVGCASYATELENTGTW